MSKSLLEQSISLKGLMISAGIPACCSMTVSIPFIFAQPPLKTNLSTYSLELVERKKSSDFAISVAKEFKADFRASCTTF